MPPCVDAGATVPDILHAYQKKLDKIEQSGCPQESELIQIKNRLETYETELRAIQNEIIIIDEEVTARGFEIADKYEKLELRVTNQLNNIRRTKPTQWTNGGSAPPVASLLRLKYRRFGYLHLMAPSRIGSHFTIPSRQR